MQKVETAKELLELLREMGPKRENTVDTIIAGEENNKIRKLGFCWLPYMHTLRQAYEDGVNVMVVHEPTFYTHREHGEEKPTYEIRDEEGNLVPGALAYEKQVQEKWEWIVSHGMTIVRCHDMVDAMPETGIPFSFGRALGFTPKDCIHQQKYVNVYRFGPMAAGDAVRHFLKKLAPLQQQGAGFYGEEGRMVSTVAVGTGCFSNPVVLMGTGADMVITIDDAMNTWVQGPYSEDTGYPLMVVNHGTSETSGMETLCGLVQEATGLECCYYPQGCGYRWISAE